MRAFAVQHRHSRSFLTRNMAVSQLPHLVDTEATAKSWLDEAKRKATLFFEEDWAIVVCDIDIWDPTQPQPEGKKRA